MLIARLAVHRGPRRSGANSAAAHDARGATGALARRRGDYALLNADLRSSGEGGTMSNPSAEGVAAAHAASRLAIRRSSTTRRGRGRRHRRRSTSRAPGRYRRPPLQLLGDVAGESPLPRRASGARPGCCPRNRALGSRNSLTITQPRTPTPRRSMVPVASHRI